MDEVIVIKTFRLNMILLRKIITIFTFVLKIKKYYCLIKCFDRLLLVIHVQLIKAKKINCVNIKYILKTKK